MNAREFLTQARRIDCLIKNKTVDAEFYRALAEGSRAIEIRADKIQSSPSQDKMEQAIIRCIELQDEIATEVQHLIDVRRDITAMIEGLPGAEYDVLHRIYMQGASLDEVSEDINRSVSAVQKLRSRGLRNVQRLLDERGERDGL